MLSRCKGLPYQLGVSVVLFILNLPGVALAATAQTTLDENTDAPIVLDDGSVYYPASGTGETVKQVLNQKTGVDCEAACSSGMISGDPDPVVFTDGDAPNVSTVTAPPGAQITPSATAAPAAYNPIMKSFHKDEGFGNDSFGAGYAIDASINATPASGSTPANLQANVDGQVDVTAFSAKGKLLRATLDAVSDQTSSVNTKTAVYIFGIKVYSKTYTPTTITDTVHPQEQLFNRTTSLGTTRYSVFGIPVDVGIKVGSIAGYKIVGQLTVAGIRVVFTPEAEEVALASGATVVSGFLNPGVYINVRVAVIDFLRLINVKVPVSLGLAAETCDKVRATLGADLALNSLSGNLAVGIDYTIYYSGLPFGASKRFTLARYAGVTRNANIFAFGEEDPLNFICTDFFFDAIHPPPPSNPDPDPAESVSGPTTVVINSPFTLSVTGANFCQVSSSHYWETFYHKVGDSAQTFGGFAFTSGLGNCTASIPISAGIPAGQYEFAVRYVPEDGSFIGTNQWLASTLTVSGVSGATSPPPPSGGGSRQLP